MNIDNILFFDTETTGLPPKNAKWDEDFNEFPYLCEVAWIFGRKTESHIIRPDGWTIPEDASKIHGIPQEYCRLPPSAFDLRPQYLFRHFRR